MVISKTFYEALGDLAYTIAFADNDVEKDELNKIGKIMLNSFGEMEMQTKGVRAYAEFEILANKQATAEYAYDLCIDKFSTCKKELLYYKEDILYVLEKISKADNVQEEEELYWINKFREDISKMVGE